MKVLVVPDVHGSWNQAIAFIKANKDKFSVEEIEDKLSAIAFRKGISFSLISEADGVLTPQPHTASSEDIPAWLKAVEDREN